MKNKKKSTILFDLVIWVVFFAICFCLLSGFASTFDVVSKILYSAVFASITILALMQRRTELREEQLHVRPQEAYAVLSYNITDHEKFKAYQQLAIPALQLAGGRILTIGKKEDIIGNVFEGEKFDMTVVIGFESPEKARDWYQSDDYQKILPMRLESTSHYRACIIPAYNS